MTPQEYMNAARVPRSLAPQEFGLWTIQRIGSGGQIINPHERALHIDIVGYPDYTLLRRYTQKTAHVNGEVVMDDSRLELRKHLPIWLAARRRVLVTGLGLGCVVRGLLAKPEVEHIDVVELDTGIIKVIGSTFADSPRVRIHQGNALSIRWSPGTTWDYAWHDLWVEGPHLQRLHAHLFRRYADRCGPQGAWAFPRFGAKLIADRHKITLLGAPRYVREHA